MVDTITLTVQSVHHEQDTDVICTVANEFELVKRPPRTSVMLKWQHPKEIWNSATVHLYFHLHCTEFQLGDKVEMSLDRLDPVTQDAGT